MSLELWEKVCKTDPKYTKGFSRGGGFSGTAINPTYLIRKATSLWGPIGGKWGFSIEDSSFVPGANGDVIHVLQIRFRHPEGEFQTFGQTTFVGRNKNGAFTDEEAPKKSLTDALTKALSMLGFSADVHMGLYDDNKYVNDRRREEAEKETARPAADSKSALANIPKGALKITAIDAAQGELTVEQQLRVEQALENVMVFLKKEEYEDALLVLDMAELDSDEKTHLWSKLDSKHRSALTKTRNKEKESA